MCVCVFLLHPTKSMTSLLQISHVTHQDMQYCKFKNADANKTQLASTQKHNQKISNLRKFAHDKADNCKLQDSAGSIARSKINQMLAHMQPKMNCNSICNLQIMMGKLQFRNCVGHPLEFCVGHPLELAPHHSSKLQLFTCNRTILQPFHLLQTGH